MKATIEVTDRKEADLIKAGLLDPKTRAVVKVVGALAELPSGAARQRVLAFVAEGLADEDGAPAA